MPETVSPTDCLWCGLRHENEWLMSAACQCPCHVVLTEPVQITRLEVVCDHGTLETYLVCQDHLPLLKQSLSLTTVSFPWWTTETPDYGTCYWWVPKCGRGTERPKAPARLRGWWQQWRKKEPAHA